MANTSSPEDDPSSIGNILVAMGVISKQLLEQLVADFRKNKEELLGEFILRHARDLGCDITDGIIELALMKQRRMRGDNDNAAVLKTLNAARKTQTRIVAKAEKVSMMAMAFNKNVK
jgi:hypothetical protein